MGGKEWKTGLGAEGRRGDEVRASSEDRGSILRPVSLRGGRIEVGKRKSTSERRERQNPNFSPSPSRKVRPKVARKREEEKKGNGNMESLGGRGEEDRTRGE